MRETQFRIFDILTREIGNPISINKLTEKIRIIHGTAHYANIHAELKGMIANKTLRLENFGRSSLIDLNFDNYLLIDLLAEIELIRKCRFLERYTAFQLAIYEFNTHIRNFYLIKSVSLIDPERNAKLNRMELLFLLRPPKRAGEERSELTAIKAIINLIQSVSNIRTDVLFLQDDKFIELLKSKEANVVKEILSDKITIFYPQMLWIDIKEFLGNGIRIKAEEKATHPAKISEQDVSYNLARFGYNEMGTKITQGKLIGIEYIITGIMLKRDSIRRIEAIPIILAKNQKTINYNLLVFLATKYNVLKQLYHILKVLEEIIPIKEVKITLDEFKEIPMGRTESGQKYSELNINDMKKKMRTYNVLK